MSEKETPSSGVVPEKSCRCVVPPEAEMAIRNYVFRETCANSDKMADILECHGVCGDPEKLQHAFRLAKVQQIMASFRAPDGNRQVLAGKGGMYYVVDLCNDLGALGDIQQRLQQQSAGLNRSSNMVMRRIDVLNRMLNGLKASHRRRMTNKEESTS